MHVIKQDVTAGGVVPSVHAVKQDVILQGVWSQHACDQAGCYTAGGVGPACM